MFGRLTTQCTTFISVDSSRLAMPVCLPLRGIAHSSRADAEAPTQSDLNNGRGINKNSEIKQQNYN